MIPKEIISKAIEGGYRSYSKVGDHSDGLWQIIALDPTFWQALDKALGWGNFRGRGEGPSPVWIWKAQRFTRLILTGGDTEKFWDDLLHENV